MTADIVAFIRARLDEEEAVAWDACRTPGRRWVREGIGCVNDENGDVVVFSDGTTSRQQANHIALHDPARVLRQVAAMRRIVEPHYCIERWISWLEWDEGEHAETGARLDVCGLDVCGLCVPKHTGFSSRGGVTEWPCATIRAVASVWADHPDYDQGWAP